VLNFADDLTAVRYGPDVVTVDWSCQRRFGQVRIHRPRWAGFHPGPFGHPFRRDPAHEPQASAGFGIAFRARISSVTGPPDLAVRPILLPGFGMPLSRAGSKFQVRRT
jgi:hypothetical protein